MSSSIEAIDRRKCTGLEMIKTDNYTALIWNQRKFCDVDFCPIASKCSHVDICNGDICVPQSSYLKSIYSAALDMLGVGFTTREATRLGLHILPLYAIFFDLKIAVAELKTVWSYTAGGEKKVNPIYREIREHVKALDSMWVRLGYKELVGHGSSVDGDSAYCDNMFAE